VHIKEFLSFLLLEFKEIDVTGDNYSVLRVKRLLLLSEVDITLIVPSWQPAIK
jgi:hypothetical protein